MSWRDACVSSIWLGAVSVLLALAGARRALGRQQSAGLLGAGFRSLCPHRRLLGGFAAAPSSAVLGESGVSVANVRRGGR